VNTNRKSRSRLLWKQYRTPFFVGTYAILISVLLTVVDAQRIQPTTALSIKTQRLIERYNTAALRTTKLQITAASITAKASTSQSSATHQAAVRIAQTTPGIPRPFPAFDHTVFPVDSVPNWGAMQTPEEWNRTFSQLTIQDLVSVPRYDLRIFTVPMAELLKNRDANTPAITAKLFYSTRYFGAYDLDSDEFVAPHAGVDLKLAAGTPIQAIAGGRVQSVSTTTQLGLHAIIEHRLKDGTRFFSIYGHMQSATVSAGDDVQPGSIIGRVGSTGRSSGPHIHLQVDRSTDDEDAEHIPYNPLTTPSEEEINHWTVHPIAFIDRYQNGEKQ
jgi:murein DD-endopeptidase MepM/ murein hydrolase activator NlpD